MAIEKEVMYTEVKYSENKQHRYLIRKTWDKNLKKATIIMISPSIADVVKIDMTTMYILNNLSELGFGQVDIVNIFSKLGEEITVEIDREELSDSDNDKWILEAVAGTDITILAWGKYGETNKKIKEREEEVIKIISEYKDKLYVIQDSIGRKGWHPLAPAIRHGWKLSKVHPEINGISRSKSKKSK